MNWTIAITVALSLVAFKAIPPAFRGIFNERREEVQGADLMVAAALLLGAATVVGMFVHLRELVPAWIWPLGAMSVAGLVSWSMRAALGVPCHASARVAE